MAIPPVMPSPGLPRPSPQNPYLAALAAYTPPALPPVTVPRPKAPPRPTPPNAPVGAYKSPGALYGGDLSDPGPAPYPGFMSTQEMVTTAHQMAEEQFGPVLKEAYRQQQLLHANNMAQLQSIQAAFEAIGVSPKSPMGAAMYQKALADAQSSESDFAGKIVDLVSQQAQAAQGIFGDLQKTQAGYASDYAAAHKGVLRDVKGVGLVSIDPTTGKATLVVPAGAGAPTVKGSLTTGLWHVDENGNVVVDREPATKAAGQTKLTVQNFNGERWAVDPYTFEKKIDLGPVPKTKAAGGGAPELHQGPNGMWYVIDPKTNTATPVKGMVNSSGRYKPPTQTALNAGFKILKDAVRPQSGPLRNVATGAPAVLSDLQTLWNANKDQWVKLGATGPGDLPRIITALGASPKGQPILNLLAPGWKLSPRNPQEVYMDIIHAGINPYKAWQMVRSKPQYKNFGPDYFPKGAPAAETAATTGYGNRLVALAKLQLGQPYVWGGESRKEGGFDCSGLIDWAMRQDGYTGRRVTSYSLAHMGKSVKGQELLPGDVIITHNGGHVVMYIGDGKVIAAPHTGSNVQIQDASLFHQDDVRRLSGGQVPGFASGRWKKAPAPQVSLAQKYGNQYGVDPGVLLAIAGHETQWGKTGAGRQGYTLGYGVTDSGILSKYRGIANQYRYAAQTLAGWGVKTIADIMNGKAKAYASDPNWERGVLSVYQAITQRPV